MTNTPPEVLDKWRKEFEAGKSMQAIQRDAQNPDRYWNDPIQYQWEGFLHRCQTAVIELPKTISVNDDLWLEPSEVHDAIASQGYRVEVKGE